MLKKQVTHLCMYNQREKVEFPFMGLCENILFMKLNICHACIDFLQCGFAVIVVVVFSVNWILFYHTPDDYGKKSALRNFVFLVLKILCQLMFHAEEAAITQNCCELTLLFSSPKDKLLQAILAPCPIYSSQNIRNWLAT